MTVFITVPIQFTCLFYTVNCHGVLSRNVMYGVSLHAAVVLIDTVSFILHKYCSVLLLIGELVKTKSELLYHESG